MRDPKDCIHEWTLIERQRNLLDHIETTIEACGLCKSRRLSTSDLTGDQPQMVSIITPKVTAFLEAQ